MSADGLRFYNLSHPIGHNMPQWPSPMAPPLVVHKLYYHAMHDFYAVEYDGIMHRGTHMDTPMHVLPDQPYLDGFELWRFFGNGGVLAIPKGEWEYVEPSDLEAATPAVEEGDVVIVNTGWHHRYGDNMEYFGHAPGLSEAAAAWLADRRARFVGVDTANVDHPLATSLAQAHRFVGPVIVELPRRYRQRTGREVVEG